eukprot:gene20253-24253_t
MGTHMDVKFEVVDTSEVEQLLALQQAAEAGDPAAQYQNGHGVKVDKKEAARWYRQAAEQGFPHAQWNLGSLYDIGDGVPCNQ